MTSLYQRMLTVMVGEGGFGPPKSVTTDLQSAPFGRSGIPPYGSWWTESNHQPADYKSAALPLSHTSILCWICVARLNLDNERDYTMLFVVCQYLFWKKLRIFQKISVTRPENPVKKPLEIYCMQFVLYFEIFGKLHLRIIVYFISET